MFLNGSETMYLSLSQNNDLGMVAVNFKIFQYTLFDEVISELRRWEKREDGNIISAQKKVPSVVIAVHLSTSRIQSSYHSILCLKIKIKGEKTPFEVNNRNK